MADENKVLRAGSAAKRSAILAAARELFIADGFDRTSVDAIAALAAVSKRTVYDYFGDKQALLLAVFDESGHVLMDRIRSALDDALSTVDDADDLEPALIAFAAELAASTMGSADYGAVSRLTNLEAQHLPNLDEHWMADAPEELIGARFSELASRGLLELRDERRAVNHFGALVIQPSTSRARQERSAEELRTDPDIVEGVRAFLRAYTPRA